MTNDFRFTGSATFSPDVNSTAVAEALVADLEVEVFTPGSHFFMTSLAKDGTPITGASTYYATRPAVGSLVDVLPGIHTVSVVFSGERIFRSGLDGPYDIVVPDTTIQTPAYSHTQFGEIPISGTGASAQGVDDNGDGLYDFLEVTANVDVREAGNYRLVVELSAADDFSFPQASSDTTPLDTGAQTLTVRVDGSRIGRHGYDGVYTVRSFIQDVDGSSDGPPTFTTSVVASEFSTILNPVGEIEATPIDLDDDGLYDILRVTADIDVDRGGPYSPSATLRSVAHPDSGDASAFPDSIRVGPNQVIFEFQGLTINRLQLDGPYHVSMSAYDSTNAWVDGVALPGETQTFSHTQFEGSASDSGCASTTSGLWSEPGTWVGCGGSTPSVGYATTIKPIHTVTLDTDASVASLRVEGAGTLRFGDAPHTLTVGGDVVVEFGAHIDLPPGTPLAHTLDIGGSLISDGNLALRPSPDDYERVIEVAFTGTDMGYVAGLTNPIELGVAHVDKGSGALTLQTGVEVDDQLDLISGTLDLNGHRLALTADSLTGLAATLDQADGTITGGDLSYQRRFLGTQDAWRLLATPASGVPFSSLNDNFHTQGAPWATDPGGEPIFFEFRPGTQTYVAKNQDGPFREGIGYYFHVYATAPGGQPLTPATWEVTGAEHASPIQMLLPYNNDDPEQSYALMGNPFAGNLDWDTIGGQHGIGLTYSTTDSTGASVSYQAGGVDNGAGRYIAPLQAFWVQATVVGARIRFNRSVVVDNSGEPYQLGRHGAFVPQTLSFDLVMGGRRTTQIAGLRSPVVVRGPVAVFDHRAALERDARDVYFRGAGPESGAALWFEQKGRSLAIDSRPTDGGQVLDLHVAVSEPGTYTLRWVGEALFAEGRGASLTDLETGEHIDLRASTNFDFVVTEAAPMDMIPSVGPPQQPGSDQAGGSRLSAEIADPRNANIAHRRMDGIRSLPLPSGPVDEKVSGGSSLPGPRFRITVGESVSVAALAAPRATVEGHRIDLTWTDPPSTEPRATVLEYIVEIASNSSATWLRAGSVEATPESETYALVMDDVSYGTHRIRVHRVGSDGGSVASAEVEVHLGVVGTHVLDAVRPNPFRSQATLSLAVAEPQRVRAEVFDLLGRRVAVLYDEDMQADRQMTITVPGARLAPGAYIIRVQGDTFAETQKVTVIR